MARASTVTWIGVALGIALATAGASAQAPAPMGTEGLGEEARIRPSRIHVALRSATDCYRRGDYELAATYLQQAQAGQKDLTPAEQHELANWLQLNGAALQARREGGDQLRQAEKAVREGQTQDALALLKAITPNQQFLAPADKLRVQELTKQLTQGGTNPAKPDSPKSPVAQAQARSKLKQARVLLLKGNYDAAQALAQEAAGLGVSSVGGEDTPQKVMTDIATARTVAATPSDPKSLLIASRSALARGDLDQAEALAREADKVGSVWNSMSHLWSDSPSKVLKEVQAARAKEGNKQNAVAVAQKDSRTTLGSLKPFVGKDEAKTAPSGETPKSAADNTETARQTLREARKALQAGRIDQAKMLTEQARALKPDLSWSEDTPDKLIADIRKAEGIKQTGGVKDGDSENRSADPRALVKQARALYEAGKLEEAQQLAQRASTVPNVRWGLFEDSPDSLLLDLRKARYKRDQEESVRVLAEARRSYEQGNFAEAERLAHRAERLHGPYSLLELGDRPQKLLGQIDAAKSKEGKNKLPPPPIDLVKRDADKPAPKKDNPPPPVWPATLDQKVDSGARPPDRAVSQTPYAPRPAPVFEGGPQRTIDNAARVPDSTVRKVPTPPGAGPSLGDGGKARAQVLVAEARQLQREGRLLEARQKAVEAQKIGAFFGPQEDRPESVLLALSALCQKRIDSLVQQANDYAAAGQTDPGRYQRAEFELNQARQLAVGFKFDTQLIDSKLTWVQRMQGKSTQSKANSQAGIVQARHQELAGPATDSQHGVTLLNQARMEIRAGQTGNARRLAEQAFSGPYGVQEEAANVLRSIDAEEFQQKMLTASHSFDAGVAALQRREYGQASTIFRSIDAHLLSPEKQARLKEIMLAPEMQPRAISQVGYKDQGTGLPGRAQATDGIPSPTTNLKPGRTLEGDFAQQVKAMQEVEFQKMRTDGLQVQSDATKRFESGDTDRALEMLRDYTTRLSDSGLDTEKQSLLRRPIEARLQQLTRLKHQRDFLRAQASQQAGRADEVKRLYLNEEEKKKQIAELMKQYNTFFKEGKYKEAEMYATKAHELDPDDPASSAAIYIARTQANQVASKNLKQEKENYFVKQLDDAEKPGPSVNTDNPVAFDAPTSMANKGRKPVDLPNLNPVKSEKEREIYRRLDGPISSIEFKDKPLAEVLDDLHSCTGINIVPDEPALNEAGISLNQPLSMKLEGVSLKSALNLLLHQVHLTYVVANEALNITTEDHARGRLVTKIHPVLDLVIPINNSPGSESSSVLKAVGQPGDLANLKLNGASPYLGMNSMSGGTAVSQGQGSAMSTAPGAVATPTATESARGNLENVLIKLITNTIAPTSWASVGGQGTIDFFPVGMALVINQTPDIQEQVQELLNALRRLQDQEVAVEIRFITIAESFFERIGLDFNINITNNNSKYEPQIVSQQFRPFGFINSFTPKNFISGLTPAGTFTQDLNIPIKSSSFEMAVPPFGQFPNAPGANGGLSLGLAFLSDIQVFLFMEAAQGDSRTNVMQAPKLTLFNGQTSSINVIDEQFFVTNVTVAQLGGQVVFTPSNSLFITGGVSLTMSAVISADRRFVRLSLSPRLTNLASAQISLFPITTFITPVFEGGATGQPIPFTQFLQQPNFNVVSVNTTVNVPDGGTVLLGGLKRLSEGRNEFGPPILSKIPYINRLFKNVGYGRETESLLMMVTPRVIINEEEEERQVPRAPGAQQ